MTLTPAEVLIRIRGGGLLIPPLDLVALRNNFHNQDLSLAYFRIIPEFKRTLTIGIEDARH